MKVTKILNKFHLLFELTHSIAIVVQYMQMSEGEDSSETPDFGEIDELTKLNETELQARNFAEDVESLAEEYLHLKVNIDCYEMLNIADSYLGLGFSLLKEAEEARKIENWAWFSSNFQNAVRLDKLAKRLVRAAKDNLSRAAIYEGEANNVVIVKITVSGKSEKQIEDFFSEIKTQGDSLEWEMPLVDQYQALSLGDLNVVCVDFGQFEGCERFVFNLGGLDEEDLQ